MRQSLEKTPYLQELESVFKKYGYSTVYCKDGFDGTKRGGICLSINAEHNRTAGLEINSIIDPTWGFDDFDWENACGTSITPMSDEVIKRQGSPIYVDGRFYASMGGTSYAD